MAKRRLSIACDAYDYLQPLREGSVALEGIDATLLTVESAIRHNRMSAFGEYDACEFSMGSYLVARANGIDDFEAIPFFPRRMFCHRFFFVRAGSEIKTPRDLKGGRIGLLAYQNSLALMARGMLAHSYGLSLTDVTWVTAREERMPSAFPPNIAVERTDGKRTLEELLLAGDIDAMIEPDLPNAWLQGKGTIEPLFPDFEREERAYYNQTQIFPIMHVIVVKKDILERDPWIATSLYEAFAESKARYGAFMQQPHRLSLVWPRSEEERTFFGKDPYHQGFKANCRDVQTMIQFANEQGMLPHAMPASTLFAENTRGT